MEIGEAEAAAKKERTLKQRCKKYGITPEFYNALGEKQGWRCGICGRHQNEFSVSLNIDHKHFKVRAARSSTGGWHAYAEFKGEVLAVVFAKTKMAAADAVRRIALPRSIRGLLCPGRYPGCNRLLGRVDDCLWLQSAGAYLANPPAQKVLDMKSEF